MADQSMTALLKNLPTAQSASKEYHPETIAKVFRGMVVDSITGKGIPVATVLLSCPDSVANLQYARTDSNGRFQMLSDEYYDDKELFFTIMDKTSAQKWKITMDDNFKLTGKWEPEWTSEKNFSSAFIAKSQDLVYINKAYWQVEEKDVAIHGDPVRPDVYRCAATTVYPSDFETLKDFLEISTEILKSVSITKHEGKYTAHVISSIGLYYGDKKPAIFLDGVYVDDINKIINLGSERIKKIEILENERAFGDLIFYGIISITSRSNEILSTVPAPQSLRFRNDKVESGKKFVAINPKSIGGATLPFFEQLLYWNPNLEVKGETPTILEFYTSDNTADFQIRVEGISEDGAPISAVSCIHVNNPQTVIDK
jgi:hypothetical protein